MVSRPKKSNRVTASEARLPSTSATAVAASPTWIDVTNASWAPGFLIASGNHWVVRLGGGH